MLGSLFTDQRRYINTFFDALDLVQADLVLQKMLDCKGSLILTGVGKSGHIAEKIAATLVSTGTRARFLSSGHALHGDIGFISKDDLLIAFSKSGESKELLDLFPYAQKKGAGTIAIVSQVDSRLARLAELSIVLPVEKELCPYNLVPTTSTAVQLLFGDCLAVALMKAREFSLDDLALNHPAGFLGRKITLKVADLMLKGEKLPLSTENRRLLDVLHELSAKQCGCLVVVDDALHLRGIFTDGDLRRALEKKGRSAFDEPVGSFMTRFPRVISPGDLVCEAMKKMEENVKSPITVLPVIQENQVVGLIRMHDILQANWTFADKN